ARTARERFMTPQPDPPIAGVSSKTIAVAELADELGIHRPTVFKIAMRLGIQPMKRRDPARGNQLTSLVTEADAVAIRDAYAQRRRNGVQGNADAVELTPDSGW